jgi:antitoxin YefM
MSEHILSILEAQRELTRLPEQFEEGPEAIIVTRYGKPVMAILPYNMYKSLLEAIAALQETLDILKDEELMAAFRESVEALKRGETVDWEDAKRELGLA